MTASGEDSAADSDTPCTDWIAVDWGTTNLRVWAYSADGRLTAELVSDRGMSQLRPDEFDLVLQSIVGGWLADGQVATVVACGMVGADKGWKHAPYRCTPCLPVEAGGFVEAETSDARLRVHLVPGISTTSPAPDVLRGEETQIAGLLEADGELSGVLCMPGTHTKWVRLHEGRILEFQTYMTGELYGVLLKQSILRHSVDPDKWNEDAFETAVVHSFRNPAEFAAGLFSIRAESLISGLDAADATSRLSGILVGAELAAARSFWEEDDLTVIASGGVATAYASGLRAIGKPYAEVSAARAVQDGLRRARKLLVSGG